METKELLEKIEKSLFEKLEEKTGWGRNEIKALYKSAVNDTLLSIVESIVVNKP